MTASSLLHGQSILLTPPQAILTCPNATLISVIGAARTHQTTSAAANCISGNPCNAASTFQLFLNWLESRIAIASSPITGSLRAASVSSRLARAKHHTIDKSTIHVANWQKIPNVSSKTTIVVLLSGLRARAGVARGPVLCELY